MSATAPATVPATPIAAAPTASAGPFAFSSAPPAAVCSFSAAPAPFVLELELRLVRAAAFPLDRDPVVCPRERDDAVGLVRVAAFARGRDVLVFRALVLRALDVLVLRALDVLVFRALDVLDFRALLFRALLVLFVLAALLALLPELGRAFALVLRVPPDDLVVAIRAPLAPVYVLARTRLPKRSTR